MKTHYGAYLKRYNYFKKTRTAYRVNKLDQEKGDDDEIDELMMMEDR